MKIERALTVRSDCKTRLADLYSAARMMGYSSQELNEGYAAIRASAPKGTPGWVWAYLDGWVQAQTDELYREHLIFGGFINGVFHSAHRNRADYYEKQGVEPAAFADDGLVERRGHYWDATTPYRGGVYNRGGFKPFYIN